MEEMGKKAVNASLEAIGLDEEIKNEVLNAIGNAIIQQQSAILSANKIDVENAVENGLTTSLVDRLTLTEERVKSMVSGIQDIVKLADPIGEVLETRKLENGLVITKKVVPLGVVGIIYESRPNVTVDAFALCFKSGNAIILKGGKEAIGTNTILESIIQEVLRSFKIDPYFIQLIKDTSRESTHKLMLMNDYVDVLIPRGSAGLIQAVLKESTIPVIETGAGNCHIYIDQDADLDMAFSIIRNAKLQRTGVCNACESLIVHEEIAEEFCSFITNQIPEVTFYGDIESRKYNKKIQEATEADYYQEYLGKECSIKIVNNIESAVSDINKYHTKHSDAIITENEENAEYFLNRIDSAAVYVNASTRFTDGYEFGLGAEMGISTQKLHARGPMGLKELTTYKYVVKGNGQTRV